VSAIISSVRATPVSLPLTRPISSALGTYTHVPGAVVEIRTDAGIDGFGFNLGLGGDSGRSVAAYVNDELAPAAIGCDALAPAQVWQRLWGPNKARMRGGIGVWALSAVDIAVWDIVAKTARLPLHTILGGYRTDVPVYGSGGWLSLSDDELVGECEGFAAQGIRAYKFKLGSARDADRIRLLRRAMGDDFTLLADANQSLTVDTAISVSKMLSHHGVSWLEEPVIADSTDDLAAVAQRSEVPVAAGENVYFSWGFRELCERRAAAYLQPDVARCGGVTEFRKVAALAEAHRVALSSHLWHELSISLVGASPAGWAAEYAPLVPGDVWTMPFSVHDGAISVPDVPGHGVQITAEALKRFSD
jgi:D-arabinonate dehydratase